MARFLHVTEPSGGGDAIDARSMRGGAAVFAPSHSRRCRTVSFESDVVGWLPQLRRYARALTGDPAWADDLVQDTAERALTRVRMFRPESNLRAWLLTLLRHL